MSGYINASNQMVVAVKVFRKDSSATSVLAEDFVYFIVLLIIRWE